MKLTKERKNFIDSLSYIAILSHWRFAPVGDPWFQGETGGYWKERMAELRKRPNGDKIHASASKALGWEKKKRKMKLTKRQALEESIQLWTVLAKTGNPSKEEIPGPWQEYLNFCPLCEYTATFCSYCPVDWPGRKDGFVPPCMSPDSPYRRWLQATSNDDRKKYAREVLDLLQRALEKVVEEEGKSYELKEYL